MCSFRWPWSRKIQHIFTVHKESVWLQLSAQCVCKHWKCGETCQYSIWNYSICGIMGSTWPGGNGLEKELLQRCGCCHRWELQFKEGSWQFWLGFKSWCWSHMWVEFAIGSLSYSERSFSGYSSFPLSSKTNISNFQVWPGMVHEEPLCGCATSKSSSLSSWCCSKSLSCNCSSDA